MDNIYLDYNATTPIDPAVADTMRPFLDSYFGNPSSTHTFGTQAKLAVEKARKQVAQMLNCNVSEIVFTSGGSESNNYALKGAAFANRKRGNHIITSSIEHPAVYEVCRYLETQGFEVTYLPVDEFGIVGLKDLENAITPQTILVSIMHANNETGAIQPIKEIAEILKHQNILFHSDAAQSAGKIPVDVTQMQVDLLSIAGHKIYGPKGIGILYIKNGVKIEKLIHGANHEQNLRAGTENVLEIVGFGKACELITNNINEYADNLMLTRNYLHQLLNSKNPKLLLNGHLEKQLPNTLNVSFPGVVASTLLSKLKNIAASAGAACHSDKVEVSKVLAAMQIDESRALGSVRFSTGRFTTTEEIEKASEIISTTINLMKNKNQMSMENNKETIKLTEYCSGMGCACKIQPEKLEQVIRSIPTRSDINALVGNETSDDAAVYKINDDFAIVETLDFFAPIVDDPYYFGAIATANALSDIYAMGGKPLFGLNIVGFPVKKLPLYVLEDILKGAADKAHEAGISVLGGHSIDDPEPKFGMVVTGGVHPEKYIANKDAKTNDMLILTKPLGIGIMSSANKRDMLTTEQRDYVVQLMATLNKTASEIMMTYPVTACTDVTGFGLLGHLREMAKASQCDVEIEFNKVPIIPAAIEFAVADIIPGGSKNNLNFVSPNVDFDNLPKVNQYILADAQTSGGLLMAVPEKHANHLLNDLHQSGVTDARIIGKFTSGKEGRIKVI